MTDNQAINLHSVLNDEPIPEGDTPQEEDQQEETGDKQEADQDEAKAEPEQADESGGPPEEDKSVPMSAFKGLEAKYKQMRDQIRQYEEKLAPKPEAPDPIEDPEGYERFVEAQVVSKRNKRLADRMRDEHDDYDERMREFLFYAQNDQSLTQQAEQSDNPAKFGYEWAKNREKAQEEALLKKHEAAMEQRILERLKGQIPPENTRPRAPQVPNLTTAPAAASNSEQIKEAKSLADVLGDSPF